MIRTLSIALPISLVFLAAACATTTPVELENARVAYARASSGPAAQHTPTDLHKAKTALDKAEQTFLEEEYSQKTVDLAYIAERSAQIAEARADLAIAEAKNAKAKQEFGDQQTAMVKKSEGALATTREQLAAAELGQAQQAQKAGAERTAREAADQKAADSDQKAIASEQKAALSEQKARDANDALAKLAAKEEERGMVITLSGSVLFRSNDAVLMPAALARLDQVADALMAKGGDVVVEGHTDSRGSVTTNMNLSQRRAESVRAHLVGRGFPAEKILARGVGSDRPIAENTTADGRANNRRVEIVLPRTATR